jgi:outer membrane scaffolding protein for murein synthesis (MipA/OmpV family)
VKTFISIIALSFFLCSPIYAEQEVTEIYTDTGVPIREEGVSEPAGFHGTLGVGFFGSKKIIGDGGTIIAVSPVVMLRYKDLAYWSLGGGGVWLLQADDHSLRFGAGIRTHPGWGPGKDPYLAGMETRKGSLDGYLNVVWKTPIVTTGVGYYHDVLNAKRGDTASLRFSKNIMLSEDLRLTPSVGGEWRSNERVDYYYGVHYDEVLPVRPAYTGTATVNMNAGLASVYHLSHSWNLLGGVFMTRYGNGIVDSPIVTRRFSTLVYLGAGWSF